MGTLRLHALAALFFTAVLPLGGCGGGGGDSADTPSTATGRVAVLLTDASTDDFTSIKVTVTGVELLSEGQGNPLLWDSPEEVDLLELATYAELFAVGTDIPAGLYDKIRLHVDPGSLTLEPSPEAAIRLPGDKIDLNPRGKFRVSPGETLVVVLDFDAAKSLSISRGGILRPVVFVDVVDGSAPAQRLTRIRGEVSQVGETSLEVCHPTIARPDYCVNATLGANTSVYRAGADGTLTLSSVDAGDEGGPIVAYGTFDPVAGALDAVLVEVGPGFLVRPLRGTVESVDETTIELLPEDPPADSITTDYGLARLFRCTGEELSADELALPALAGILVGQEMRLDGMLDEPSLALQATLGIVASCDGSQHLEATVEAVEDAAHHRLRVRTGGEGPICVQFRDRARMMTGVDNGQGTYELSSTDFTALGAGTAVHLFGRHLEGEPCFQVEAAVMGGGESL